MKRVDEIQNPTKDDLWKRVVPARKPTLLRGLVRDWPAVRAGATDPEAATNYLCAFDTGRPVPVLTGGAAIQGHFFYNDTLDGLNFDRQSRPMRPTMQQMLREDAREDGTSLYIQSLPLDECLPGFLAENELGLPIPNADTRIWIGNRITVQTHFDLRENIACVVSGRRRFTLFPPDQTPNLYPGPFEHTLAGPPVSMVRLEDPDPERYPRFQHAMEAAVVADLEPGDALYIPYFWWHHVRALDSFNVLVNTWWNEANPDLGSPYDAMLHGLLSLRDLPAHQREAWQVMFDFYVFQSRGDPLAHLPANRRGTLGDHDAGTRRRVRQILLGSLARKLGLRPPKG